MKLETFFEKFDLFADAPDAVAKMRELVLQLAVQGRLVSQSPNHEAAAILAATIAEDRAAFVKQRSLARQRVFPPVEDDERPFPLPSGWNWTRLGNLCRVQAGFAFPSAAFVQGDSGVPMIRIRDITKDRTQVNYVGEYREEFLVEPGDYLVGMDGNFTVAMWRGPRALLNQRVSRLLWYSRRLEPSFFAVALQHRLSELQGTKAYTTVDHLSSGQIEDAVVPLPPLAEQKRIVAKVDELMAVCDRLEEQLKERETRHAALSRAALARFAEAPTPANLEYLFHASFPIPPAELRKSILALAIRGKLVSQNLDDEPATAAIDRISEQRECLISAKKIRRSHIPSPIEEGLFDIPASWVWTNLGNAMLNVTDGFHSTPKTLDSGVPYVTAKHVKPGLIDFDSCLYVSEEDFAEIASKTRPRKGDVLVVNIGAGCGLSSIIQVEYEFAFKNVAILNRPDDVDPRFLFGYLMFRREDIFDERAKGGAQPFLSLGLIREIPFPLPPLAEQCRIVAKVDELMTLVDKLEQQLAAARATAEKLLAAAVAELTKS